MILGQYQTLPLGSKRSWTKGNQEKTDRIIDIIDIIDIIKKKLHILVAAMLKISKSGIYSSSTP